jgi:MFS family permease
MSSAPDAHALSLGFPRVVGYLLNLGHAVDHMFLLIFATAVTSIAADFGYADWADLMPYTTGAFFLFGLGAVPAGRLGDVWSRRAMMIVFFVGLGGAALLTAAAQNAWQLGAGLTILGAFAAIYHPVGIPMLVQHAKNPGAVIGFNGLAGNLGIAVSALITGLLVKWLGWRAAFAIPGFFAIGCGIAFAWLCPRETEAPAKRKGGAMVALTPAALARAFTVMTAVAVTASLLFNFTTNGNAQLLAERFVAIIQDPALLGLLLASIYALASLAQIVVGHLIDRMAFKPLNLALSIPLVPLLLIAANASGWLLFVVLLGVMILIFGAIPFTDAMIVRYVDDRLRSRVAGMRLAVSAGISSAAVWLLGPFVKTMGFGALFWLLAGIAAAKALVLVWLPREEGTAPAAEAASRP